MNGDFKLAFLQRYTNTQQAYENYLSLNIRKTHNKNHDYY